MEHQSRYSRGYLPHTETDRRSQFITWRLADSIPSAVLREWEEELRSTARIERGRELQSRIERFLDSGYGSQILAKSLVARTVQEAIIHGHQGRFALHRWVVMPTHVHVLLTPYADESLAKIVHGIKSYTSKEIGKLLNTSGKVWQADYFDRWMRSEEHFARVAAYIEWNPVKAKLCEDPALWPFSSANRDVYDRIESMDGTSIVR